ncbi:hypothetical protein ABZ920_01910 [Streptomyces sp. NPDC046831]|uniref:hypothetical protein n=1 Tax=Streptomyces sp. NPDC046831 TaxID=3154805 RepID=UPI0033CADBED
MDRRRLVEATAGKATEQDPQARLAAEDVDRVLNAVFGTVEHPGTIAEALRNGETVVCGSFGSFHGDDGAVTFRPGKALAEFLEGSVR